MVQYGERMVQTLRDHCDSAQKRIWITSPFIGHLNDIERILGIKWKSKRLDCRILTDVDTGFIMDDTFSAFKNAGLKIKSLLSLHAKIYIVDDWCLVTSANLTGTAFSMRYEVGEDSINITDIERLFQTWWNLPECREVSELPKKNKPSLFEYQVGDMYRYTKHNDLPLHPRSIPARQKKVFNPTVIKKLSQCIDLYYETWDLYHVDDNPYDSAEGYKWLAFKKAEEDFKDGTIDMSRLLNGCLTTSGNLLAGNMYYPRRMLRNLSAYDDARLTSYMARLFDEHQPLDERIKSFLGNMQSLTKEAKSNDPERYIAEKPTSQQSPRSASVYLALRYRTNHYLYKPRLFQDFAKLIDCQIVETNSVKRYLEYESFCDSIREEIEKRKDLMALCEKTFGDNDYNSYLMTQDMMYCVIRLEKEKSRTN